VTGLFDQVAGTGFVVAAGPGVSFGFNDSVRASLAQLGAHLVRFVPPSSEPGAGEDGAEVLVDVDGGYLPWLRSAGYEAVVIRPDYYVFGGVASASDLPALVGELAGKLGLVSD
jgi:flavoprotein hydroxylase